jgi:hypothetical protein
MVFGVGGDDRRDDAPGATHAGALARNVVHRRAADKLPAIAPRPLATLIRGGSDRLIWTPILARDPN